ncbi:metallophosphoesterase family protein [Corynebacterium sp. AOP40-9SA-29]|uniref:metallophosphoesterase family protein n=1 Tax=Corynebacterium sp. AOP40-9SA-29 TaxID=3457677 RepID=UPI00403394E1
MFRFMHTSDWQLGMDRWFLGDEAGPRYREARLAAVERLLTTAGERGCGAVVVAGDVFDDNLVDPVTWRRAVDILRRSPVPVFLLPGNHDPYDAASVYRSREFDDLAPTVQVLTDSRPRTVAHSAVPAEILGAPLLSKYMSTDPVAAALTGSVSDDTGDDTAGDTGDDSAPGRQPGGVRILVGHGATQSRTSGGDPAVIDVAAAAEACREGIINFLALGDTHSVGCLHPDGTVWYSGSPEVTDFREEDGGGEGRSGYALIVDVAPDVAADAGRAASTIGVEEISTGRWRFQALSAHINGPQDVEEWIARLEEMTEKRTTVVKYALTGSVDLATAAVLDEEMERVRPAFAALYERQRLMDLHVVPGDEELAGADWPGVVGVAARELADRGAHEDETAQDALRLLYRLSAQKGN